MIFKNPCFFAEGGEKEEKSRGKNEKAIIIIAVFPKRSTKKSHQTDQEGYVFNDNILSKCREVDKNSLVTS